VPTKARNGANPTRWFPAKSGPEDLQVSGPAEGAAGAHSTGTPGSPGPGASRGRHESDRAVHQREKTKDGVDRDVGDAAELH